MAIACFRALFLADSLDNYGDENVVAVHSTSEESGYGKLNNTLMMTPHLHARAVQQPAFASDDGRLQKAQD